MHRLNVIGVNAVLDLLGSPSNVRLAHVWWWFDRRNELESDVPETDDANDRTGDDAEDVSFQNKDTNENINYTEWMALSVTCLHFKGGWLHVQIPRPRKENKKDACRDRAGGTLGTSSSPPVAGRKER